MTNTFEDLTNRVARRGRPRTKPPLTRTELAKLAGLHRQHLYLLLNGERQPQDWVVASIARGWKISEDTVRRALRATRVALELQS